ncbi:hypothetical protein ACIRRA_10145 [Nocardia sp. NPDC101769]
MGYEIPEWALDVAARLGIAPEEIMRVLTGAGRDRCAGRAGYPLS